MGTALQTTLLIILAETSLILLAATVWLIYKKLRRLAADRKALGSLLAALKPSEAARRGRLTAMLRDDYGVKDEALAGMVDGFIEREKALYRNFLEVYLRRDSAGLTGLSGAVDELLKPYCQLHPPRQISMEQHAELEQAYQALQKDFSNVQNELKATKCVMEGLMREYTAAFDKRREGAMPQALRAAEAAIRSDQEPAATMPEQPTGPARTENDDNGAIEMEFIGEPDALDISLFEDDPAPGSDPIPARASK